MIGLAALVGSVIGSGGVFGVLAFFVRRWMYQVDDSIRCMMQAHPTFRTKAEADRDWSRARKEQDDQWSKLTDHDRRITRIEAACELKHGK